VPLNHQFSGNFSVIFRNFAFVNCFQRAKSRSCWLG